MGAGKRFDLAGENYAAVRGLPWSLPAITLKDPTTRQPLDLTGCQAKLLVFDPLAPASAATEYVTAPLDATGEIAGLDLSAAQVSALPVGPSYQLLLIDSFGKPRPYLRGRLEVLDR